LYKVLYLNFRMLLFLNLLALLPKFVNYIRISQFIKQIFAVHNSNKTFSFRITQLFKVGTAILVNKWKHGKVLLDKFSNILNEDIDMHKIIPFKLSIPTGYCKLRMLYLLIFLFWFHLLFYLLTLRVNWA
jgi:hypothetical protein